MEKNVSAEFLIHENIRQQHTAGGIKIFRKTFRFTNFNTRAMILESGIQLIQFFDIDIHNPQYKSF